MKPVKKSLKETLSQGFLFFKEIFSLTFSKRKYILSGIGILTLFMATSAVNISIPFVFKYIIDQFSQNEIYTLSLLLIGYGVIWTMGQIFQATREKLLNKIIERVSKLVRIKILETFFQFSVGWYRNQKIGNFSHIFGRAQQDIPQFLLGFFSYIFPAFFEIIIAGIILLKIYPFQYYTILLAILLIYGAFVVFSSFRFFRLRKISNAKEKRVSSATLDWVLNFEMIKVFGREEDIIQNGKSAFSEKELAETKFITFIEKTRIIQSLILGIGITILTFLIGYGVSQQQLTTGDFVLFHGYLLQFLIPFSVLGYVVRDFKKALVDVIDINTFLYKPTEAKLEFPSKKLEGDSFHIEFKNVCFSRENRHILENISLEIRPNQPLVIMGETGSGKSTLISLLLRFFDVDEGKILINGMNIKDIDLKSLYQKVSLTPQEIMLFNENIYHNILFSDPYKSMDDVIEASRKAQLLDFINQIPQGFMTKVGEKGIKISGGEKQRVALARAFLRQRPILLLDEPTSALDPLTEKIVNKHLREFSFNKTLLMITHKQNQAQNDDRIIFLEKGRIIKAA